MTIANDHVVEIDYTLKDDQGKVLDTSEGKTPLAYLHGGQNIIPGLELQLDGKAEGDEFSVTLEPKDGYGERRPELINDVPRSDLANLPSIEVGMQLQAQTPQGPQIFTVLKVADDQVTLDANHPLAGETLHFDVKVQKVRKATEEELEHGHAHGAGGHQH